RLLHDYAVGDEPVTPERLVRMARDAGLRTRHLRLRRRDLECAGDAYPFPIRLTNGNWVVLLASRERAGETEFLVSDPLAEVDEPFVVTEAALADRWDGHALLMKRARRIGDPDQPFGVLWFFPELLRQRRLLLDVALAVVFLYGIGLATPIFFQIVIDKVLVHQTYTTLTVLSIGIVLALLFDAAFTFLRRYLLLYATNRIEIRVATRTFRHLLSLPVGFFESAPAGV